METSREIGRKSLAREPLHFQPPNTATVIATINKNEIATTKLTKINIDT